MPPKFKSLSVVVITQVGLLNKYIFIFKNNLRKKLKEEVFLSIVYQLLYNRGYFFFRKKFLQKSSRLKVKLFFLLLFFLSSVILFIIIFNLSIWNFSFLYYFFFLKVQLQHFYLEKKLQKRKFFLIFKI